MGEKLSHEEFVRNSVVSLRKEGFKGIHLVYPGVNEAFQKYFNDDNPIEAANRLANGGKIVIRPVKGGLISYMPEDAPGSGSAEQALKKMGLG